MHGRVQRRTLPKELGANILVDEAAAAGATPRGMKIRDALVVTQILLHVE